MPNILGGGQNFVQSGNRNGGTLSRGAMILGSIFGAKANIAMRDHLITHQTNENIRRDEAQLRNKAIYGAAGAAAQSEMGADAVVNFYNKIYARYGENHPDVVSGKRQATDYINPELAAHATEAGIIRTPGPLGTQFGSTAGEKAANARREASQQSSNTPSKKFTDDNNADLVDTKDTSTPNIKDVKSALKENNEPIKYPFSSTVGSSGRLRPTKFDESGTPVYSEENAEIDLGRSKEFGQGGNK